jgi:hypothetical protein
MKLKVVPASQGFAWMKSGVQLCLKQPLGFVSLLGLLITGAMVLMALPLIGPLLVVTAMPVVWMAFMLASRRVLQGQRITPNLLIEPLKDPVQRRQWLRLGGLYAGATLIVMVVAGLLGPDMADLAKAIEAAEKSESVLNDPTVITSMLWRMGLTVPMSLLFWHTPALLFWGRIPPVKALFFSAVASWRNLGAFAVYGVSWIGALLLVGVPLQLLAAVVPEPLIVNMVAVAAGLWVAAAFYASLYFSVVECFEDPGTTEPGLQPPGDDPLKSV